MSNPILRILDANFNRAREALRVMEEYARFVLDDASLTAAIKGARHELREIANCQLPIANSEFPAPSHSERSEESLSERDLLAEIPDPESQISNFAGTSLIAARNTPGDVGTIIEGGGEYQRASAEEVVIAAGKRLSESLRVLEEFGKLPKSQDTDSGNAAAFAKRIEHFRYSTYELERRLAMTLRAKQRFGEVRLYVLLTESLCRIGWFETAEAIIRGGAHCIQLREKTLSDAELLRRAKRLAALCREHGIIFIVNDRADIAVAAHAHGVHVGQDDISVSDARRTVDTAMIVGVSTHTMEQFHSAIAAAPDYIAIGPMFPSETKPQPHIAGPALLSTASTLTSLPLVAIGGIHAGNAGAIRSAAANCAICVCSAIISKPEPEAATRKLLATAR